MTDLNLAAIGNCSFGALLDRNGRTHRVLTETPRMGRTEGFAPVELRADQPIGAIVELTIRGSDGARLTA